MKCEVCSMKCEVCGMKSAVCSSKFSLYHLLENIKICVVVIISSVYLILRIQC